MSEGHTASLPFQGSKDAEEISTSVIFEEHSEVKKELWGEELWEDEYFARKVGDKVTGEVINEYIRNHRDQEKSHNQLKFFYKMPHLVGGVIHYFAED